MAPHHYEQLVYIFNNFAASALLIWLVLLFSRFSGISRRPNYAYSSSDWIVFLCVSLYAVGAIIPYPYERTVNNWILVSFLIVFLVQVAIGCIKGPEPNFFRTIDKPFLAFSVLLYLLTRLEDYKYPFNWDDYSHWLRIYKVFSLHGFDEESITRLSLYPEYGAIHSFLLSAILKYQPSFENVYYLFTLILLVSYFHYLRLFRASAQLYVVPLTLIIFNASTPLNHNLQVDNLIPLLTVIFAHHLLLSSNLRRKLIAVAYAIAVTLTKPTGIIFVFLGTVMGIARAKGWRHLTRGRMAPLIFAAVIYGAYLLVFRENINPPPAETILHAYYYLDHLRVFFGLLERLVLTPIETGTTSKAFICTLLVCICGFMVHKHTKTHALVVFTTFAVYLVALSGAYTLLIDPEGFKFPSADRYIFSFTLLILFYTLLISSRVAPLSISRIILIGFLEIMYFMPLLGAVPVIGISLAILFFPARPIKSIARHKVLIKRLASIFVVSLVITLWALRKEDHRLYSFIESKIFASESMLENARFLYDLELQYDASLHSQPSVVVCDATGYDYLATAFRNNFKPVSIIKVNQDDCIGYKYRLQ